MRKIFQFLAIIFISVLISCSNDTPIPRPKGYFRITYPPQTYKTYKGKCPISFEYPSYAEIQPKNSPSKNEIWFNIEYSRFDAALHVTYINLKHASLKECLHDAHDLAFKHTVKASAINENVIRDTTNDVYGVTYDIRGNAASNYQFFLTDSSNNFLRASLYFHRVPNADSLEPVIKFIKQGVEHTIKTMRWAKSDAK